MTATTETKQLDPINSAEGSNTRVHPQILAAYKHLAITTGSTVWMSVNRTLLAELKRRKACPADWNIKALQSE